MHGLTSSDRSARSPCIRVGNACVGSCHCLERKQANGGAVLSHFAQRHSPNACLVPRSCSFIAPTSPSREKEGRQGGKRRRLAALDGRDAKSRHGPSTWPISWRGSRSSGGWKVESWSLLDIITAPLGPHHRDMGRPWEPRHDFRRRTAGV